MQNKEKYIKIAKSIKILILDVDGVMTDGGIYYDNKGGELKKFNVLDGLGIKILINYGIEIGIISGMKSKSVINRAKELGIKHCYQGEIKKYIALKNILTKTGINKKQVAYIGDDIIDLSVMRAVGLPIAVANAQDIVKENALLVTTKNGGEGAIREICDYLLKAQGKYDEIINFYNN